MKSPTISRTTVRSAFLTFGLAALLVVAQSASAHAEHFLYELEPVTGSEVSGHVELASVTGGGTIIRVTVMNLEPGTSYASLYYSNFSCDDSAHNDEAVGVPYRANSDGRAVIKVRVTENIDDIQSVSVRLSSDMSLLACADTRNPARHTPPHK
ncbi:MAG: hypothetical protein ACKVU1_13925 [bacterium]